VDSQWIIHQKIPSLGSQGTAQEGKTAFQGVKQLNRGYCLVLYT
jgi:hypothetical protein